MQPGLPFATAQAPQAGVISKGFIYESFGNWVGTEMWLTLIIKQGASPGVAQPNAPDPPRNLVLNWSKGTKMADALKQCISTGMPGWTPNINISDKLVAPVDLSKSLAWPLLVLCLVLWFRKPINDILTRLHKSRWKANIFSQTVEFDLSEDKIIKEIEEAITELKRAFPAQKSGRFLSVYGSDEPAYHVQMIETLDKIGVKLLEPSIFNAVEGTKTSQECIVRRLFI